MPLGRRRPTMTGADFLITMASDAVQSRMPYAVDFQSMVMQAFGDEVALETELIARRSLKDHEASPVAIILAACQAAAKLGDKDSLAETLRVGLNLLAKWPDYLAAEVNGHPTLQRKQPPEDEERGRQPSQSEPMDSRPPLPTTLRPAAAVIGGLSGQRAANRDDRVTEPLADDLRRDVGGQGRAGVTVKDIIAGGSSAARRLESAAGTMETASGEQGRRPGGEDQAAGTPAIPRPPARVPGPDGPGGARSTATVAASREPERRLRGAGATLGIGPRYRVDAASSEGRAA